jgi:hypothetical protein
MDVEAELHTFLTLKLGGISGLAGFILRSFNDDVSLAEVI